MSDDQLELHIGENSREKIAYELLKNIASIEHVSIDNPSPNTPWKPATREWLLKTYKQCLHATKGRGYKADDSPSSL